MKKTFVTVLLAVLLVAAVSLAEDLLLDAAWAMLTEVAKLVERDMDDGVYEYDFRSDAAQYEVVMTADGAPLLLKTAYTGVKGSESAVLDEAAAVSAALAHAGEGASADLALLTRSDKRYLWTVFVVNGADVLEYEINAGTGEIREVEVYYGASGGVLPSALLAKLKADKGDITLTDMDLELDDGRLVCTGEATLGSARYEFEALASDGSIWEWERD